MNNEIFDVIILGSGPAGLTGATYLSRSGFRVLVFGKKENSRLFLAHQVSNYFGFPEDIAGEDLLNRGITQAKKFGSNFIEKELVNLKKEDGLFKAMISDTEEYKAKAVLIATGAKNISSKIKGEEKFVGKGISFCVACDGSFFKEKNIAVIGEGDFAAEEALGLLNFTNNIVIYSNSKEFSIKESFIEKIKKHNISLSSLKIIEFFGSNTLEGIILENGEKIKIQGAFIAQGTPKSSDFANKLGISMSKEYITTDDSGKTNVDGIFAAGDACGFGLQIGTAVGSAINASFSIIKFLKGQ